MKCGYFASFLGWELALGPRFLQVFGQVARQSAENVHFYFISVIYLFSMGIFSPGGWVRFLYFAGVIFKHIIILFFLAVFELALSR